MAPNKLYFNVGTFYKALPEGLKDKIRSLEDQNKNFKLFRQRKQNGTLGPYNIEVMTGGKRMTRKARMSRKRKTMRRRR